jgi:ABC-type branched-subunit amino acid transport system ATPase component
VSSPILSGSGLSISYGGVKAVDSVDIELREGEILGLIGPNGAGKTSLIDGISGFTAMSGRLELDGNSLARVPPHRRRQRGLSRTWQSIGVFDDLTLIENVAIAAPRHGRSGAGRAHLRHTAESAEKLELVGLGDHAERLPGEVSHGQQVLVGVARALVGAPRVLFLDEPAAGLDDSESVALENLVRSVAATGVGIVLVDHDLSLITRLCDRLHVLDFGRTVASGTPDEVTADPRVIEAYIGRAAADAQNGESDD